MTDVLIVGAGPAGLTAAIYARRAGLTAQLLEQLLPGGQMGTTPEIRNYPGFPEIDGMALSEEMKRHALNEGAQIVSGTVTGLEIEESSLFRVRAGGEVYEGRTLILATGAIRRKLDVPGEEQLAGAGVSYCAVCDGNFFKGREVAVVGGGNTALEDAAYLARLCSKVYLIHRRDQFRGSPRLLEEVQSAQNVVLVTDTVVREIQGKFSVEGLALRNKKTGEESELKVSGVFVAVGTVASSELLAGRVPLDSSGRVLAGEDCRTPIPGLFAAGDLRAKPQYQIITAAADGANAAASAISYLTYEGGTSSAH